MITCTFLKLKLKPIKVTLLTFLEKDQLPIKLTSSLKKQLIRNNYLKKTNSAEIKIKRWVR